MELGGQLLITETELFEIEKGIMLLFAEGFPSTELLLVLTTTLGRRCCTCWLLLLQSLEKLIELTRFTASILEVAKPLSSCVF